MVGYDSIQSALKFTNVLAHRLSDRPNDLVVKGNAFFLAFCLEYRDPRFKVRGANIRNHAPLKTRDEAIFDSSDGFRRTVRTDNDLLIALMEGVEGMKEFFLRLFLASDELDVVDEQNIDRAIRFFKPLRITLLDSVDEVIRKFLAIYIEHLELCI